jgi:hypothetical protein
LAIFDWWATLLMGIQWRGAWGLREKGERKEEEAWQRRRSNELINSKSKRLLLK